MNEEKKDPMDRRRHAVGAFLWTLAAALSLGGTILGEEKNPLMILLTLAFAVIAGIFWVKYMKERQEEKDHD